MNPRELDPALVAARLAALRRIAPAPELLPGCSDDSPDRDMGAEAVARRLDELRALDDLARWLARASRGN